MLRRKQLIVASLEARHMLSGNGLTPATDVANAAEGNPNYAVIGDLDGDGYFLTSDLVAVFTSGKYETGECASFEEGDWNRDGEFNSSDLVYAFSQGHFENPDATVPVFLPGLPGVDCPPGHQHD